MKDYNVYIKQDSGRYKPIGLKHVDWLPDGIWYVRHHDHSIGSTNVDRYLSGIFRVGDAEVLDFPQICGMQDYVDYILNSQEFKEIYDKGSYSFYEVASKIVALVFKFNKEHQEKHDDNKRP